MSFAALGILSIICCQAFAEYRAFLLKITSPAPAPPPTASATTPPVGTPAVPPKLDVRLVRSNLSAEQYPTYYPLVPGETIEDVETWMCRGRTGEFQQICDNPNTPRAPAANTPPPQN